MPRKFSTPIVLVPALMLLAACARGTDVDDIPRSGSGSTVLSGDREFLKEETNIVVDEPTPGSTVDLPLTLKGKARVFENAFSYRVRDADDSILIEGFSMAQSPDIGMFGPFDLDVIYPQPKSDHGFVEVFDYSAKDGYEQDMVRIPVKFAKTDKLRIKLFFGRIDAPEGEECETIRGVDRAIVKASPAKSAIEELLKGPSNDEELQGATTSIPEDVKLQKIAVAGGVATVDFNAALNTGGACRVTAIRKQIEETLLQFPTVDSVIISVNGNIEEALQP